MDIGSVPCRVSRQINRWIEYALFGLGFSMAIIVALQVFFRYVLNYSLFWSEELARYQLVWLTFLGATVAYRRKFHPGIDILTERMPRAFQKCAALAVHLVSIGLFVVMIWFGVHFAWFIRMQISPALQIPKWIILGIIPLSGLIMLIHAASFIIDELGGGASPQTKEAS